MAKQLNVILDDEDHRKLLRAKGKQSWARIHHAAFGEVMHDDSSAFRTHPPLANFGYGPIEELLGLVHLAGTR